MAMSKEFLMRKRAAMNSGDNWKARDGRNQVRILPPKDPRCESWFFDFFIHWIPTDKGKTPIVCNKKHNLGHCFICEQIASMMETTDKETLKRAKDMEAKNPCSVVNLMDVDSNASVQKAIMPFSVMGTLIACELEGMDISNPDAGRLVVIHKNNKNNKISYETIVAPHPSPLEDKSVLTEQTDLFKRFKPMTYEQQKQFMYGEDVDEDPNQRGLIDAMMMSAFKAEFKTGSVVPAQQIQPQSASVTPPPVAPQPAPVQQDTRQWYVSDNGVVNPVPETSSGITFLRSSGKNPQIIPVGCTDASGWKLASEYGF